jgi:NADH-quinone oxidoreductase subunit J
MTTVTLVFWIFAAWAVVSALLCITRENPVASALWLVSTMFALAGIFVLLNAEFIAAIQVLVYAGAVMVLFLFVIMLLNVDAVPTEWKRWPGWVVAVGVTGVLVAELVRLRAYSPERLAREVSTMPDSMAIPAYVFPGAMAGGTDPRGVVGTLAEPLFQAYLIPFEITSVLLLAAVIGAVVLAKKRL